MSDELNCDFQPTPAWLYIGLVLTLAMALAGWFIPEFYDWTGADQSRPAPIVAWIALAIAAGDLLAILGLLVWHVTISSTGVAQPAVGVIASDPRTRISNQFSIRQLLLVSAIIALLLAASRWISPTATAAIAFALVAVWALVVAKRNRGARWWIAFIVCSQFLPFLWLGRGTLESFSGHRASDAVLSLIPMSMSLPSLFPFGLLGMWLSLDIRTDQWFFICCSALNLVFGVWLSCQGPKRTLAYGLTIGTCSLFGSFILNALMRA